MIDTHCHIFEEYYENDEVIKKMEKHIMIVSGIDNKTNKEVLSLCLKYSNIYGTLGIHPSETESYKEEDLKFIEENINNKKILAIGEIGLDYHYEIDKSNQKDLFIKQLMIAKKYKKPVVIHSREAINDTYELLKKYIPGNKKIMHCYSGSYEMALKLNEINCIFGFGGTITFKNNVKSRELLQKLPLSQIILETDSPYLTPEPFRGKKNEPYNIVLVASKIAEIKNIPIEEIIKITTLNAISQFDLKPKL